MRDPGSVRSRLTDPTNDSIKISNFLAKNNRRSPRHACVPTNRSRREPHESNNVERACTNKTSETKGHFSHLLFPSLFLPINYPPDFVLHRGEISTSDPVYPFHRFPSSLLRNPLCLCLQPYYRSNHRARRATR